MVKIAGRLIVLFLFVVIWIHITEAKEFSNQPKWCEAFPHKRVYKAMKRSKIRSIEPLTNYLRKKTSNRKALKGRQIRLVNMATLSCGLKVIWKQCSKGHAHAEQAAYKVARALGERFVPPAVFHKHRGKYGVLSFYVSPYFKDKQKRKKKRGKLCSSDLEGRVSLFHYCFNWDAHAGNILYQRHSGKFFPAAIDNAALSYVYLMGGSKHPYLFVGKYNRKSEKSILKLTQCFKRRDRKTISKPQTSKVKKKFRQCSIDSSKLHKVLNSGGRTSFVEKNKVLWGSRPIKHKLPKKISAKTRAAYQAMTPEKLKKLWRVLLKSHRVPKALVHCAHLRIKHALKHCR